MTVLDMFFARLSVCGPIEPEDMQVLLQLPRTPFIVPAQTAIFRPGEAVDGAMVLLQGFACRSRVRTNGSRQILSILIPGDALDLAPAFEVRDDLVEALTTCRGVHIPCAALATALTRPSIRAALGRVAHVESNMLAERVTSLGRRAALERMAHLFCELVTRMDVVGLGANGRYDIPLTQADLADALGLSVVHVNRTLQQLRASGAITFRNYRLTVHDFAALSAIAEFQPGYLHLRPAEAPAPMVQLA